MNDVITAISTVGFPIVMTLVLLYMMDKQNTEHKLEIDKLDETLKNNTLIIQKLYDHLTGSEKHG